MDANSFYCSCEQVFDAALVGKPLVVLSNNDGCVVARSTQAKELGVKMGQPWFELRALAARKGPDRLLARSSNYALYGDMSARMVTILRGFAPAVEVYSIDESFLDLGSMRVSDIAAHGHAIRSRVGRWLGLPVCVGAGPTKTLAKMANHLAKKQPRWQGVCDLTRLSAADLDAALRDVPVEDVWGVGRRLSTQLAGLGIDTALALRRADPRQIRQRFSVVLERTVRELQGVACMDLELAPGPKDQIMCSRSFGQPVCRFEEMQAAVMAYAARAAEKLRRQASLCRAVHVFIHTNAFRSEQPQHSAGVTVPLTLATADSGRLLAAATFALRRIWRDGYAFAKAGVMLLGIIPAGSAGADGLAPQADLFAGSIARRGAGCADAGAQARRARLMQALDTINRQHGRDTLRIGLAGAAQRWDMRQERKSPRYTTRWDELMRVKA